MSSILSTNSFSLLDRESQYKIRTFFAKTQNKEEIEWNIDELFNHRAHIVSNVNYYQQRIKQINPASFRFLNRYQRTALLRETQLAFYVLSAHYKLDLIEQRKQSEKKQLADLKLCENLITKLRIASQPRIDAFLALAVNESEKPVKYLGLRIIAPFLAEQFENFKYSPTAVITKLRDEINEQATYWARSNAALLSIIKMLPDDFASKLQAQEILAKPSGFFGYINCVLSYIRLGINLFLLLKHTVAGPWMNEEEKQVLQEDRLSTQWDKRKFLIISDFIWATLNMLCFLLITGTPFLNYSANLLTAVFMAVEIGLTLWRINEETTQHNKNLARLEEDIEHITEKINSLEKNNKQRLILEEELKLLIKNKKHMELEWKYHSYTLTNDLIHGIGLLAGFAVITAFLIPPASIAAANLLIFNLVGAVMFFGLTLAYTAISNCLTITKSHEIFNITQDEIPELLARFKNSNNIFEKKQLYLDIRGLMSESEYQKELIYFQKLQLARSLLVNILSPPLIVLTFLFMPFSMGLTVIAAGWGLVKVSNNYLIDTFKPDDLKHPEFDEKEYKLFEQKYSLLPPPGGGDVNFDSVPPSMSSSLVPIRG